MLTVPCTMCCSDRVCLALKCRSCFLGTQAPKVALRSPCLTVLFLLPQYHKGAKPFPAGRNSGIIELAECRGRGNRKLLFSPPAQRTDRVSVGSVWFPQLSDFLVRPEGLVALGWTCPGTGLTPVPAFRKRSDFHGLLATKDGAAD